VRRLYTLLLYLALPLVTLTVAVRGLRQREYWRGWSARFGFGAPVMGGGIWVHAVSVGEVQAAAVLIEALAPRWPESEITLSCATPTARLRARALLPQVPVSYAPYDLPGSVRRCLARLRPRLLIVLETELWPNLLHQARCASVPVLIASARVSERSMRRYARFPGLLRAALANDVWVGAQTEADGQRFAALGVPPARISVSGNIKFDRTLPPGIAERGAQLRARYGAGRPVWVAGSTHAGEEPIVLAAHRRLLERQPHALLILAPRHPQRFAAATAAIAAQGLRAIRRTGAALDGPGGPDVPAGLDVPAGPARPAGPAGPAGPVAPAAPVAAADQPQVLLLDTLGELSDFYAAADVAFVGGSLVPIGGHNLLEPAALGLPVLSGPAQFNAPQVAQLLQAQGALTLVHDADQLAAVLARLLSDRDARAAQGAAGLAAIDANRGALQRLLKLVEALDPGRSPVRTPAAFPAARL
jgi:3-deoxy-D-manno-octulosonic-acid transferase